MKPPWTKPPPVTEPLTEAELAEVEAALADPNLWQAPWTAHRFEIDCPCPNGNDCGDPHTCDEVESREAYPCGEPGHPSAEGKGQCVVQIDVPGIETFSLPTARTIALLRNRADALVAEVRRRRLEVEKMRDIICGIVEGATLQETKEALFEHVSEVALGGRDVPR